MCDRWQLKNLSRTGYSYDYSYKNGSQYFDKGIINATLNSEGSMNVPDEASDTLAHLLLQCKVSVPRLQAAAPDADQDLLSEAWEAAISQPDLVDQRQLVARARRAVQARGFLE
uniref:Uncharacterized protein n=1 Tax=Rhipicephalus zambeziensis TaxID=60191 RepID=A0A224Z251_9ACAR